MTRSPSDAIEHIVANPAYSDEIKKILIERSIPARWQFFVNPILVGAISALLTSIVTGVLNFSTLGLQAANEQKLEEKKFEYSILSAQLDAKLPFDRDDGACKLRFLQEIGVISVLDAGGIKKYTDKNPKCPDGVPSLNPLPTPATASATPASLPSSQMIDTPVDITRFVECAAGSGVSYVARFYRTPSTFFPPLSRTEAVAISAAGMRIATVWETRADTPGHFSFATGVDDGAEAFRQAVSVGQPPGSVIFFAVDYDASEADVAGGITDYFKGIEKAAATVGAKYKIGVYGSGRVIQSLKAAGLASAGWLSMATGWAGRRPILEDGTWDISQGPRGTGANACGVPLPDHDVDTFNPNVRPADLTFTVSPVTANAK